MALKKAPQVVGIGKSDLQLQPISEKTANDLRRWASELLKIGCNNRLALRYLMDELIVRTWFEKSQSGVDG